MKKIYIGICLLFFGLAYGCNDFLEESSQDEMRPSSIEDLEQIVQGSCYFNPNATGGTGGVNFYHITDIFTDNIQCNGVGTSSDQYVYENMDAMFTWDINMFRTDGDGDKPQFYNKPYVGIGACNVILDYLDQMEGDRDLREYLRGEVLALRAWYYFHLVNFFGLPYNSTIGSPEENPGVPLQLTSSVVEAPASRNTVKEVYDQILGDLTRGFQLMSEHYFDKGIYRLSPKSAAAMLSRVYLCLEDWDKAIAYADTVLSYQSGLLDLNTEELPDLATSLDAPVTVYNPSEPTEILWVREYSPTTIYTKPNSGDAVTPWSVSDELSASLFEGYTATQVATSPGATTTDLRAYFYFQWTRMNNGTYYLVFPDKPMNRAGAENGRTHGIRTAEVYLNRAEAYIRKAIEGGNDASFVQKALDDLNLLRSHRYMNYTPLDVQDASQLLDICLTERRKELVGEMNNRWFDIRRCGITYSHTKFAHVGEEVTVDLKPGMYALPIPQAAMDRNSELIQNVIYYH